MPRTGRAEEIIVDIHLNDINLTQRHPDPLHLHQITRRALVFGLAGPSRFCEMSCDLVK